MIISVLCIVKHNNARDLSTEIGAEIGNAVGKKYKQVNT